MGIIRCIHHPIRAVRSNHGFKLVLIHPRRDKPFERIDILGMHAQRIPQRIKTVDQCCAARNIAQRIDNGHHHGIAIPPGIKQIPRITIVVAQTIHEVIMQRCKPFVVKQHMMQILIVSRLTVFQHIQRTHRIDITCKQDLGIQPISRYATVLVVPIQRLPTY